MINEEWLKKFTKEWIDVTDCQIDFSKHETSHIGSSLHVIEKQYKIEGETYRVLWAIGSDIPLIQKLKQ